VHSNHAEPISLLLVSTHSATAALLRRLMEQHGLSGEIRRVDPGRGAIAVARRGRPGNDEPAPDIVMLDFAAAEARSISFLQQIARGTPPLPAPVVLLTSPESEALLRSGNLRFNDSRVFAPTSLPCFMRKMREHPRQRFLRALSIMADLGPILVDLPDARAEQPELSAALSA